MKKINLPKILHKIIKPAGVFYHAVKKNKLLSNEYLKRILIICFFLGLNLQLLPYFLKTTKVTLPSEILSILDSIGVLDKNMFLFEYVQESLRPKTPSLDPRTIFEKLNSERISREKKLFIYNEKLVLVAQELLLEAEKYEFELEDRPFTSEFKTALKNANYAYEQASHNMVVGPLLEDGVIDAWLSNEEQVKTLFDEDFTQVGLATKIITTKHNETLGVTVLVLGVPAQKKPQNITQATDFPPISNEEVFEALNRYRESHNIYRLSVDENLCKYAEKRVQDWYPIYCGCILR